MLPSEIDIPENSEIEDSGGTYADPQRPLGEALSEMAKSRPKLDYSLGSEGDRTLEYFGFVPRHDPGRVLALGLSVHHIATPVTACSSLLPEFQPHGLVAECITTKACTS